MDIFDVFSKRHSIRAFTDQPITDEALGKILAELDARGLRDETLIIVTADHGGHDTTHGSSMPEDMTIPWIVSGPFVQPKVLTTQVHTMDTAATAAFMLGQYRL